MVIIMVVVVALLIVKLHDYIEEFFKFASVQDTVSIDVRFCEHLHNFSHFIVAIYTIFRSNIASFYIYGSSVAESECSRCRCNFACGYIHTTVTFIMVVMVIVVVIIPIRCHEFMCMSSRRSPSYVMRILWNHNRVHSNITHVPRFICAVP